MRIDLEFLTKAKTKRVMRALALALSGFAMTNAGLVEAASISSDEGLQALEAFAPNALPFRAAQFTPDETATGSGALLIAISADRKTAWVNLHGVKTELPALGKNQSSSCLNPAQRQWLFGKQQTRLQIKITTRLQSPDYRNTECAYEALAVINVDKHVKRYMLKAVEKE